jgi:hypothetical protein
MRRPLTPATSPRCAISSSTPSSPSTAARRGAVVARGADDAQPGPWRATAAGGGPKGTKHLVTNVIVEVDESGDSASARSGFTVLQATGAMPLQPIIAGRYHDGFRRIDDAWRFVSRRYIVDLFGDAAGLLGADDAQMAEMRRRATGWS